MSKFTGFFKDWQISRYKAWHKDKRVLWIGNGFSMFKDQSHENATLHGFNLWERYLLWREFKAEVKRRNLAPTQDNPEAKEEV